MIPRNPKVNVYVDAQTYRKVRKISELSGRAISSIVNGLLWKTFSGQDYEISNSISSDTIANYIRPGKWCRYRLYTRLPRQIVDDLGDLAWGCKIKSVSGKSSGVGVLTGYAVALQLRYKTTNYWVHYFRDAEDYLHRISPHLLNQEESVV
jgi:hypothetical protein